MLSFQSDTGSQFIAALLLLKKQQLLQLLTKQSHLLLFWKQPIQLPLKVVFSAGVEGAASLIAVEGEATIVAVGEAVLSLLSEKLSCY